MSKKNQKVIIKKVYVHEEHEEHVDERWLVSYSDMMTLLFGLFVMLYAMQDPESSKKMQESIKQQFTETTQEPAPLPKENPEELKLRIAELEEQLKELENLKKLVADTQIQTDELKKKNEEIELKTKENLELAEKAKLENEELKNRVDTITEKSEKNKRTIASVEEQDKEIEKRKLENKNLADKIDKMEKQLLESKNKLAMANDKPEVKSFEKEYQEEKQKKQKAEADLTETQKKNQELIDQMKTLQQKGSFAAIVLNWTTDEHDLDLVIKDPSGKKFNFKNRTFSNHPGKFVLDSRRGPGAEIWQADRIVPGVYEAEVTFYNQYNNPAPAEAKLIIFSPKGNKEIGDIKLDLNKNSQRKFKFEITADGDIVMK